MKISKTKSLTKNFKPTHSFCYIAPTAFLHATVIIDNLALDSKLLAIRREFALVVELSGHYQFALAVGGTINELALVDTS